MNLEEQIRLQLDQYGEEAETAESLEDESRAYGKIEGFLRGLKMSSNEQLVERACKNSEYHALIDILMNS